MKNKVKSLLLVVGILMLMTSLIAGCGNDVPPAKNNDGAAAEQKGTIRIGYQKNCPLAILMSRGNLDERMKKEGYTVEWKQFTSGPALFEALNAGSVDFGRTGDSPPIFAQASGTQFIYVIAGNSKFLGSGILVPQGSPIKSLKDLKGKRIAFAKGSSSHFLLVKALEKAGVKYSDITPAYLQPGDGRIALEQGNVDAWVVWDPFAADAEINSKATMLVSGEGLTSDRDYFLANRDFAQKHKDVLRIIVEEIDESSEWANSNHEELVKLLAPLLKIDEASLMRSVTRREYGTQEITPEIIKEQQVIADTFYGLKILPKKINVNEMFVQQ